MYCVTIGCTSARQASLCMVIIHECLRCMYDTDLIIRLAALASLKQLCSDSSVWCGLKNSTNNSGGDSGGTDVGSSLHLR